jgi:alpha-tubulin suppressor-like RCC1 family protein
VEGLEGVRGVAAAAEHSLAVTQSGTVFSWGHNDQYGVEDSLRPVIVAGFGGARMRRVCAGDRASFAIGEDGELFSWGPAGSGVSATATLRTSSRPSASRRPGAFR